MFNFIRQVHFFIEHFCTGLKHFYNMFMMYTFIVYTYITYTEREMQVFFHLGEAVIVV